MKVFDVPLSIVRIVGFFVAAIDMRLIFQGVMAAIAPYLATLPK